MGKYYSYNNSLDDFYSLNDDATQQISAWLNNVLNNTTRVVDPTGEGQLTPVEDVNPDNVLATLLLNSIVCVMLLGLYEVLRRWIPSVYSQRFMNGSGVGWGVFGGGTTAERRNFYSQFDRGASSLSPRSSKLAMLSSMQASGSVCGNASKIIESASTCGGVSRNDGMEKTSSNDAAEQTSGVRWSSHFHLFEWVYPIHSTPWSTIRQLAGLDAYFFLRYIRMCLKITAVSSFWALAILWPVYATGGGEQSGFYFFSMANVSQSDKWRVWVPTFFCWAFTMYCWFCIRSEMVHYVDLRMHFLGGEEEENVRRLESKREMMNGYEAPENNGDTTAPGSESDTSLNDRGISNSSDFGYSISENDLGNIMAKLECAGNDVIGTSSSFLPTLPESPMKIDTEITSNEVPKAITSSNVIAGDELFSPLSLTRDFEVKEQTSPTHSNHSLVQLNQHRYSLQVEKVPADLRSNNALFAYFNEMFPNQIHSVCMAMNVPDLDALSARRQRVNRRLEKSMASWHATGTRPTHVTGRPRFKCCNIESNPVDGCCLVWSCCCLDWCHRDKDDTENDHECDPGKIYDHLPEKGAVVDSLSYYTLDLAQCNCQMKTLQRQKFLIAETGSPCRKVVVSRDGHILEGEDWYIKHLDWAKEGAAKLVEGLREEFEVLSDDELWETRNELSLCGGEEDVLCFGKDSVRKKPGYGSFSSTGKQGRNALPLVEEDHLCDQDKQEQLYPQDARSSTNDSTLTNKCVQQPDLHQENELTNSILKRSGFRYHFQKKCMLLRALLWRMGVDFLAAGLDEVRNSTDVVVDSVTRPSMSSTGFVTFKTLTPVTVSTSAPLTYNGIPMEVFVAPEPRDIVWQNVQIDSNIGAGREFIANVLLGLGVVLWSIPLTLIQAWAKVEKVALIPGFDWIEQIHGGSYKPLINGYLPVLTLLGLIMLLPLIFQWVATSYEKRKTYSEVENSIVGRYFYYQLANIYITVTAGAIWTSLSEIIDHPQKLLVILGQTLPKVAGYFISLLITKTLAGLPMVLLRAGALSRMAFLKACFNNKRLTQRELDEVYRKQPIMYGWEYPTQFLVIIICFTYACITPIILPVGAVFFFCALLVYKKQALYVYTPTYESGGALFPQAVNKTLFALLISQMTFIGYTLIRKGVSQLIFLAPLPFLTIFVTIHLNKRYVKPSTKLSLERAIKMDALADESQKQHPEFSSEAYQQPVLTEKALAPMPYRRGEQEDSILAEVLENLQKLQSRSAKCIEVV